MSTKKTKASKKGKDLKKDATEPKEEISQQPNEEVPPEIIKEEIKTIIITIEYYKNIHPIYPISDVKTYLKYLGDDIGESELVAVTDDEQLPLSQSFELEVDINSPKQVDNLASNGLIMKINQSSGIQNEELYEQLKESEKLKSAGKELCVPSLFSMYEMFSGDNVESKMRLKSEFKKGKKGKESTQKSARKEKSIGESEAKLSKTSKASKRKSSQSKKSSSSAGTEKGEESSFPVIKSDTYGIAVVDFVPLLHGLTSFTETLIIKPVKKAFQMMNTYKNAPQITVTLEVKENTPLINLENVLSMTIESICNIPTLMLDMDCKICVLLPLQDQGKSPTMFLNPKIKDTLPPEELPKKFPSIQDSFEDSNKMKNTISSDLTDVKNKAQIDLQEAFKNSEPRLEFNCMKRNILYKKGLYEIKSQFAGHRRIVLEILLIPKNKRSTKVSEDTAESFKLKSSSPHLHLMAIVDVASFLYPGVTRLRVACPINTFSYEEAKHFAGLEDSFFLPIKKSEKDLPSVKIATEKGKEDSPKKKGDKASKSTNKKEKSSKGSSAGKDKEKDLKSQLPPKPSAQPEPEPSIEVFNENGKRTFIILEIELLNPITPKRDIKELKADLEELERENINTPKTVLNVNVAKDFFSQTINEIIKDLNQVYSDTNLQSSVNYHKNFDEFISFLQKSGKYQTYLSSIATATAFIVANKYKTNENLIKNDREYQNLISEVFTFLTSEMNSIINTYKCRGMKPLSNERKQSLEKLRWFAKEAIELRNYNLANRYFLERIYHDQDESASSWFDYALYFLQINEQDKAFESIKESLAQKRNCKFSLLVFAALLTDRGKTQEAEICFLNILVHEPKWVEGWATMYLFYQKVGNEEGMDMALEMCQKYLEDPIDQHKISQLEDLPWSSEFVPKTLFFREAVLMLKLRLFAWVEKALAQEVYQSRHYGDVNYLMAVLSYYQKDYEHALDHIEEARTEIGSNYAIQSLAGHIYVALEKFEEANGEYLRVIESYNRPDNIHLVYINGAFALEKLGDHQTARKLLLTTCKYNQTPYVWMTLGKLYYIENDLLSAEECFFEANMRDNRHPDIWAYLTLINLKVNKTNEAEQCYQQAMKSNLKDEELIKTLEQEFKRLSIR